MLHCMAATASAKVCSGERVIQYVTFSLYQQFCWCRLENMEHWIHMSRISPVSPLSCTGCHHSPHSSHPVTPTWHILTLMEHFPCSGQCPSGSGLCTDWFLFSTESPNMEGAVNIIYGIFTTPSAWQFTCIITANELRLGTKPSASCKPSI